MEFDWDLESEDLDEISCNAGRDSFIEDYCEETLN